MIDKPTIKISEADIKQLIINNVLEHKTLEYKSQLPGNADKDKREFLNDVSSFANTIGGDLIFGIKESQGQIESDYGLIISNVDEEISRLENIIRDGISPRIKPEIISIHVQDGKFVILIRIHGSLQAPHRVVFGSHDKFYARNSNGKYPMDVLELRNSFAQSSSLVQRIKDFRNERILNINRGEVTAFQPNGPYIALHVIPLSAFNTSQQITSEQLLALNESRTNKKLRPFYAGNWNHRINLLGVMAYSFTETQKNITTYTQLYREGIIESVDIEILHERNGNKILAMGAIENQIILFCRENIELLKELGFQPPFYIFLTLGNVRDYSVSIPRGFLARPEPITVNDLLLPEAIIDTEGIDNINRQLRPVFDIIWNTSGLSRSLNFDDQDNFIK